MSFSEPKRKRIQIKGEYFVETEIPDSRHNV